MIRQLIEPGTEVFHVIYGIGVFKKWSAIYDNDLAVINFKLGENLIPRKELTEIEPEPKKEQEFNPPV